MKVKNRRRTWASGFTLLELLAVVAIIATLGAMAIPGVKFAMKTARMNAAAQQTRQIMIALHAYSQDNGGRFPAEENIHGESISDSNSAFRDLMEYLDYDERVFAVGGSNWGSKADMKASSAEQMLKAGECHFAYISGLTSYSRSSWPVIVDGTTGSGLYTRNQSERGGVWAGTHAIVARLDGSAGVVRLRGSEERRYLPRIDDDTANSLELEYMGGNAQLLDPAG